MMLIEGFFFLLCAVPKNMLNETAGSNPNV